MNRWEGAKKVGPPQKNSLDPLLSLVNYTRTDPVSTGPPKEFDQEDY